jgi:hypothetical protein
MASKIKAIQALCPRILLGTSARIERFLELITQRTTLSTGVVKNVQETEIETLIGLLRQGQSVHTGTAIYTPNLRLNGKFDVSVRADPRLIHALNAPMAFRGKVNNPENIGKTSAELFAQWNALHPDDPVV